MSKTATIIGTGSYLPERIVTNFDLEKIVDTTNDWIVTRTGIQERHIAEKHETPATMAEIAARRALDMAGKKPEDIDLILVATCTPEKFLPNTACLLQNRLKTGPAIAFDVSAACTGFVYALDVAHLYFKSGRIKNALIVGSEVLSRAVDWNDRNTCVLFGDGAGAVILEASDQPGIIASRLYADGTYQDLLDFPTGLFDNPGHISMQGREVFKLAVMSMSKAVDHLLEQNKMSISDVDWIIPHQANYRILSKVVEKVGLPNDRVIMSVTKHANTSSASIPLAFDEAVRDGRIKKGQTVLFAAFGGGLTWGANLFKY